MDLTDINIQNACLKCNNKIEAKIRTKSLIHFPSGIDCSVQFNCFYCPNCDKEYFSPEQIEDFKNKLFKIK